MSELVGRDTQADIDVGAHKIEHLERVVFSTPEQELIEPADRCDRAIHVRGRVSFPVLQHAAISLDENVRGQTAPISRCLNHLGPDNSA
jgi:hypothetical protein